MGGHLALCGAGASGGGGGILHAGDFLNESWEGADTLTWTDTGTVNRNAALSGTSPLAGLGSQCLEVNWDGAATRPYSVYDRGSLSAASPLYYRIYFQIVSHSTVDTDHYSIFTPGESPTPLTNHQFYIGINNVSGQLQVVAVTGGSSTTAINISAATWYKAEIGYVNNSVGASQLKLFSPVSVQIGATQTWNTGNNLVRYIFVGLTSADDNKAMRVQIDGLGVDTTGFLGE